MCGFYPQGPGGERTKKLKAAFWIYLEGLLAKDDFRKYWAGGEPGDWDIIPAGIVEKEAYEFDRCAIPEIVPDWFGRALNIWNRYRDGFLMYSGGYGDQPIIHGLIIDLFNDIFAKWERSKRKK